MKNKIFGVSSLVKKPNYDTKISELEEKLTDHNHDKYIYIYIYIYITFELIQTRNYTGFRLYFDK